MYHHVKKLMYHRSRRRARSPLRQYAAGAVRRRQRRTGRRHAVFDSGTQLRRSGAQRSSDGHRHRGTEPSRNRRHARPHAPQADKFDREAAEADPLIAIAGGGGVNLFNSQGNAWTADYLKITGELDVDLRSNIAAEARAKIVYERLINFCDDAGTKDALQFLMTREITHMKAFTAALESMGKPAFRSARFAPTPGLVDQFFNDSTGEGDDGEIDARGPWNEGGDWEFVESPAIQAGEPGSGTAQSIRRKARRRLDRRRPGELLVDELRDILHAEKQLIKALPKMAKAARIDQLRDLFEMHLGETESSRAAQ